MRNQVFNLCGKQLFLDKKQLRKSIKTGLIPFRGKPCSSLNLLSYRTFRAVLPCFCGKSFTNYLRGFLMFA